MMSEAGSRFPCYCDLGDSDICRLNLPLFIVVLTVFTFILTSLILIAPLVFVLRG